MLVDSVSSALLLIPDAVILSSSDHHLTSSPDFTNQHHLQPSSRWPLQVSRHRDEDRLLCLPSSHDKTRHRQTQQKRLRGHGGPGGVSLYWRQRRSQLRMEAWIQCGFWGHLRCGLGRIANSSATIGDHGNATRLHSRLFPPNGGRFGSVVAGGRDRVPGALFPFFLSIFFNNSHGMLRCTVPN